MNRNRRRERSMSPETETEQLERLQAGGEFTRRYVLTRNGKLEISEEQCLTAGGEGSGQESGEKDSDTCQACGERPAHKRHATCCRGCALLGAEGCTCAQDGALPLGFFDGTTVWRNRHKFSNVSIQ